MKNVFANRLKQARIMQGFSMEQLCKKLDNIITRQSVSKYETGKMMPDSTTLISLSNALRVSVDYFFRPLTITIDNVEFRKGSHLSAKQIDSIKEIVKDKLERYFEIESIFDIKTKFQHNGLSIQSEADIYSIANQIKNDWKLGDDGINNLIEILEENNIKVIEIDASNSFKGLSGTVNGDSAVIVFNQKLDAESKRFTALHELGHLILDFDTSVNEKQKEDFCNLFAVEMLISRDVFMNKLGMNRHDISLKELQDIQTQYGISIDSLMYKAKSLNIITPNRYKTYFINKKNKPLFKEKVEESRYKREESSRFERLVFRALASDIISISKASTLLNLPITEVRNQLNLV